jgi:hypothetical protein
MANVVTYVLVSNPDDPDAVREHDVIDEHGFDLQKQEEDGDGAVTSLRFAVGTALQEDPQLERPVRELSKDFPEAVVTFCEVEERFDNVEHFRTVVYTAGHSTGEIEHGFRYNVGAR